MDRARLRAGEKRRSWSGIRRGRRGFTSQFKSHRNATLRPTMLNRPSPLPPSLIQPVFPLQSNDDVAPAGFTGHLANEDETTS